MPSLDLWRQAIDDAIVRQGILVNNTPEFWHWLQVVHYHQPKLDFSENLAMEILDNIKPLVADYNAYKARARGR